MRGDSIAEIKMKLKEQSNNFDSCKANTNSNDGPSVSIGLLRGALEQKLAGGGQNNYQSKLFDAQGNAEISKIRELFEKEDNVDITVDEIETKSSYEWAYKKKSILELQKYLSNHGHLVPASISKPMFTLEKNLGFSGKNEIEVDDEADKVAEYNNFMEKVDQFLNAPDKSSEEIDFKSEIEKYLDLIEEPANEEEKIEHQKLYGSLKISRKPKKLDMSSLGFENDHSGMDLNDDERGNLPSPRQKDSKFIRDMQMRLIGDATKDLPKEELVIHNVGTSRLTREYEKLGKTQEVSLLTAPKIVPKKTAEELAVAALSANDPKQADSTNWKWKQKDVTELYHHIKESYEVVPPALLEHQKNLLEAENTLEKERAALAHDSSLRSIEMLKRLEEQRDQELENFLSDVQQFLGQEKEPKIRNFNTKIKQREMQRKLKRKRAVRGREKEKRERRK